MFYNCFVLFLIFVLDIGFLFDDIYLFIFFIDGIFIGWIIFVSVVDYDVCGVNEVIKFNIVVFVNFEGY